MRTWASIDCELQRIQEELCCSVNRLWKIKLSFRSLSSSICNTDDFLHRRLTVLRRETQAKVEARLSELQNLVTEQLGAPLSSLDSELELDSLQKVRRTLRALKNAYASEAHLALSLNRLHRSLPRLRS